jgi:hypothetical protein
MYGSSAVVCRDENLDGDVSCARLAGTPPGRYFYAATAIPGGGIALLSRSVCSGLCSGISYYLATLPAGVTLTDAPWSERRLSTQGTSPPVIYVPLPQQVAAGGDSLVVFGVDAARTGLHTWQFSP